MKMKNDYTVVLNRIREHQDPLAFREIYDHFFDRLYAFSMSFLKNRDDAQAVVSDVFINLWKNREKLPEISDLSSWLYICTRNKTFDYLKRRLRDRDLNLVYSQDDIFDLQINQISPEREFLVEELFQKLEKALETLPARQRVAFQLIRLEQMSYKEAAEVLDISVSGVEKLIAKATAHLLRLLQEYVHKNANFESDKTFKIIRLAVWLPALFLARKFF